MGYRRTKKLGIEKIEKARELKFQTMILHEGDYIELTKYTGEVIKGVVVVDFASPTKWSLRLNNKKTHIEKMYNYNYAKKDIHYGHHKIYIH